MWWSQEETEEHGDDIVLQRGFETDETSEEPNYMKITKVTKKVVGVVLG